MRKHQLMWLVNSLVLTIGITLSAIGITYIVNKPVKDEISYQVEVDATSLRVEYFLLQEGKTSTKLTTKLAQKSTGLGPLLGVEMTPCAYPQDYISCLEWKPSENEKMSFKLQNYKSLYIKRSLVQCFEVEWISTSVIAPVDCFPLTSKWFGGSQMYNQYWPINKWNKHMSFYLTGDMFDDPQQFGSVLERYWLSSDGVAIFVKPESPLHISIERDQICLKGLSRLHNKSTSFVNLVIHSKSIKEQKYPSQLSYSGSDEFPYKQNMTSLSYFVCLGDSPQITHQAILKLQFIAKPNQLPDLRMMKSPIWSTWARYKIDIDQKTVMSYANEILSYGFSNSQLEIDDGYEEYYGDHTFDTKSFPNATYMVSQLHDLGFRVTSWVTPFINPRSFNYQIGVEKNAYIINGRTNEPGNVVWWNGVGYSIDFTNQLACDWYFDLLQNIRETYKVDSFKFDAGELNYVYKIPEYKYSIYKNNDPGYYTQKYIECVYRFGKQIEIRAAWRNQNLPIFIRMMDKDSNWSYEKGLKTLIPTALTFSLIGYPYILPDMIGGNAYEGGFHNTSNIPERQLYIRWLQLTTFLPAMQFSISPWQYDDDVIQLSRHYVNLHETIIYDELVKASQDYIDGRASLGPIRPIWWVTQKDTAAFDIDDQFMVGDRYLVAPIVEQNATSRDVYLPGPKWRQNSSKVIWWKSKLREDETLVKGGTKLFDYPISLEEIAWWELVLK